MMPVVWGLGDPVGFAPPWKVQVPDLFIHNLEVEVFEPLVNAVFSWKLKLVVRVSSSEIPG
jgi:hypothetical protein